MVRLNNIYTKTGDAGETGLADGSRVAKSDPVMAAIGDVDEANSAIGLALIHIEGQAVRAMLGRIQNELFDLGADLATPGEDFAPSDKVLRIVPDQVERLEQEIDAINQGLAPLRSFILPSGGAGAAHLHLARAVVRRAERSAVAASRGRRAPSKKKGAACLNPLALIYLNRLSDLLFVLARRVGQTEGGEVLWRPGSTREPSH